MIKYKRSNPIDDMTSSTKRYLQLRVLISKRTWIFICLSLIVVAMIAYFFGKWRGKQKTLALMKAKSVIEKPSAYKPIKAQQDKPEKKNDSQDDES